MKTMICFLVATTALFAIVGTAQAEDTTVCPISALDEATLAACKEWQVPLQNEYNCTADEYLQMMTPGKYKGVVANYLSFNTAQSTGHFVDRAKLFEKCTGGVINFAEATDIAEDPIKDLGSAGAVGSELHDGYLMIYSFTSEASSLGLLETLNDRIRESNNVLKYEDIFPKVRSMGEYRKDGKTNIDILMADGDYFVPIIRLDLLQRDKKPLPHTWEDLVDLAKFYNGTDLNDDGVADDFGFCIYPRTGSGFNDAWIPELMYSTWATTDQTKGIQQGFLFDQETFEPRIGKGFEHAMNIWKDLWANSADGCITNNFVEGRCAIGYAPPGCWKGVFVNPDGVSRKDDGGNVIWRPTFKNGNYAEPYLLKPFGSLQVINRATDQFEECTPGICPKGEVIQASSRLTADDRARVLADSPHVGKLINRVPFYWSGGYGTAIRKSAEPASKDLMWDFFVYVNTPITSIDDVVKPSWLDSWRYSQLESYERNFKPGGWSFDSWNELQKTMHWALSNEINSALTLRLPGVLSYSRDVVLGLFQLYMEGKIHMEDVKIKVRQGWLDVTASQGKLKQVQIYRASLGVDPLSEFDMCRLHRTDMDAQDNTVCVKYDPKDDDSRQQTILIAVLIPALLVILAAILGVYREQKRRQLDSMWKVDKNELKFKDPPEIAGRGTFGLVIKAEYRGTIVAVKRVIPPKEMLNRAANKTGLESTEGAMEITLQPVEEHPVGLSNPPVLTRPRRRSMDHLFEETENTLGSKGKDRDLELGGGTHTTYRRASAASGLSSTTIDSLRTSNLVSRSGSTQAPSKKKWVSWFGYRSSTKSYDELKRDFLVEMRVLSKLRHPCITTVMGCVIDKSEEPMLVMEFMYYGSLRDLLNNASIAIDGELIFPILQDIARGARFLHAAVPVVVHGDLKAANVLVDSRFRAKLADFGLSAKRNFFGATGTPYWMAPELLRREAINSAASDVYSFGIILYEVYSRKEPYEGEDPSWVLDGICDKDINKRPPMPKGCPSKIQEIMHDCIESNPERRPTFEEIDLRIQRLNSEIVEPEEVVDSHQHYKKRAEQNEGLIHEVFPKHVAKALLEGRKVEADRVDMATMFFSDIVGFTTISEQLTPDQVSDMLDRLYLKFDALSVKHNVFKIETIGDAYVGVCNLVEKQDIDHAKRIAEFAIETVRAAAETLILLDHPSMGTVKIRVGIHSGPLVARVVGSRNPRYCVFGDTVNTTARMESHSLAMKIHCSDCAAELLKIQGPHLILKPRGIIEVKGKGEMSTFFIHHEDYQIKDTENSEDLLSLL